jgi:hypothetical protein
MITTGHLLIGGAVGVTTGALLTVEPTHTNWWAVSLALALGVLSHHLLDLIPHTDAATFFPDSRRVPLFAIVIVTLEISAGFMTVGSLFLAQHTTWAFAAGAVGGILPDLFDEIPLWQMRFRRNALGGLWHRWHTRLHCRDMAATWRIGLLVDAFVVGAGLWFLLSV